MTVQSSPDQSASVNKESRRSFVRSALSTAGAAAAIGTIGPTIVKPNAIRAEMNRAPSDRIHLGVVGIGPRCTYDLKSMLPMKDVQVLAIADVQKSRREKGKTLVDGHYGNKDCELYRDFREMLAREDIDAVIVATGDRWHADASIAAAEAGKDVYSEKPCGITIKDCQNIDEVFTRTNRIFQAGTQRRSVPNFVASVQMAQTGELGELQKVFASTYQPTLENNWLPGEAEPKPEICDWNLWLGPAPWRPFNQEYVNGRWRGQYDFDSGARLLDWGAHTVDLCQWANQADETIPISYEPKEDTIVCTYKNGVELVIDFIADPFGNRGPKWISRLGTCPVRFVGTQGSIETGDEGEIVASSPDVMKKLEQTKRVRGLDVSAHARNFFDCIRSREPTVCNPKVMRRSHVACHAAALAWILGRKLTMDPATEMFVDDDEANRLRSRPKRDWS